VYGLISVRSGIEMSSDNSDIWAGIGTIVSSIASAYAWLYSIGLVPLFTFITGVFFTIWAQERLEKKRRKRNFRIQMTKYIYGPLHRELSTILRDLRVFHLPSEASLKDIAEDFRFSLVKEELQHQIEEFQKMIPHYTILWSLARKKTDFHISIVQRKHKIERDIKFNLWVGEGAKEIFIVTMEEPIFEDKTPLDYLTERARRYTNTSMMVHVGQKSEGAFSKEHRVHQISLEILAKVREDASVQEQREERKRLLEECSSLVELIEKEIVL
jgi:hypothetical protein